jgi:hypothetical protein
MSCRIDPERVAEPGYVEKLQEMFSLAVIPVNWANIEDKKGGFDFSKLDECFKILRSKKMLIGVGPLLTFTKGHIPARLLKGRVNFEKIREAAYKFAAAVAARYAGQVRLWRVIGGLNVLNHFSFNFEQIIEMTRAANLAVKGADGRAIRVIDITNPWGEYYSVAQQAIPPVVYMDMLIQSGIHFDAFGFQIRFGKNVTGMRIRDMMQISAKLDQTALIAKPLYITELEVPSSLPDTADAQLAGVWHGPWDQARQGQWLEQFYKIALSKIFVEGLTYSNLIDTDGSVIPNSGLLTKKLEEKDAWGALKKVRVSIFKQ